ncbi:hypothetical protein MferCBS31731_007343 [Microsporum ferrugineum]
MAEKLTSRAKVSEPVMVQGDIVDDNSDVGDTKGGTSHDGQDMWRIGQVQELNRNFRFLSVLGFAAVLMCTWEAVMFGSNNGLTNGGVGGMIYSYIAVLIGFCFVIPTMAEMASMAPSAGGQYHWVSEFAPAEYQQFLSYLTGWICVLGWHTGIAGASYTVANMIIGLIHINYPKTYDAQQWHVTLLVIAIALTAMIFNSFFAQKLPLIEGIMLLIHCFGFFGVLITLWVVAPTKPASYVFRTIEDNGNWGNTGLACLIGIVGPIYALIGPDSAVHMAEEIKDASIVLPRAMIWTLVINGGAGLAMLITYASCVNDARTLLKTSTGLPFVQVFLDATGSVPAATGMTVLIIILQGCSAISNVATTSRQMYAFARDGGLPFSNFISKVDSRFVVPLNALSISFVIVILLALINIGSSVAFNAILSLGVGCLLTSYIISIGCVRLKRWRGQQLPPARWNMGKWSSTMETVSLIFLVIAWVFSFFPLENHVNAQSMNWSCVILGGVVIIALIYYASFARHTYKGPVTRLRPWAEMMRDQK